MSVGNHWKELGHGDAPYPDLWCQASVSVGYLRAMLWYELIVVGHLRFQSSSCECPVEPETPDDWGRSFDVVFSQGSFIELSSSASTSGLDHYVG